MTETKTIYYKYEVADLIGVSKSTVKRWLNKRYFKELEKIGYERYQKYVTGEQLEFLKKKLSF